MDKMLTLKLISNIRAQVQKIINFKDQWGGWPSKSVRKTHGCKVWRSIKVDIGINLFNLSVSWWVCHPSKVFT